MGVHILQKAIIDKLRMVEVLRYSQLQPRDLESSHFKYHLDQLIKASIVERRGRGEYGLSEKGRAAVDRMSANRVNPETMPKVITYTLLQDTDNYYLYKKTKEPYLNLLNMVGGKMHFGETPQDASVREVQEKTELTIIDPELLGSADIHIYHNDQLFSHAIAYIYSATIKTPSADVITVAKKDITTRSDLAPDLLPLLEHIQNDPQPFVISLQVHL